MFKFFPERAVALSIGPVAIHWYGLLYLLAFLIAAWLIPRLQGKRGLSLSSAQRESLIIHCILGVLLGGRLGYILFYGLNYYLAHPLEIIAVWHGGMSSHGGVIGVVIALILFCRREKINILDIADVIVVPVAIGLCLGRLGNLINGELYGTVTSLPWGMHFPGVEGARHPTQIYAIVKDSFIATICYLHLKRTAVPTGQKSPRRGETAALFLISYGVLRFIVEIFRDQPFGYTQIIGVSLSRGQLLTLPVIVAGALLFLWLHKQRRKL